MNQNEMTYEGQVYVAKPVPINFDCTGCAFFRLDVDKFIKEVCENKSYPSCHGFFREDGTSIIWVKKETKE